MKIAENQEFLIVDTENDSKPFIRVVVFIKNKNTYGHYSIADIEDNLYSPFDDDWEKRVSELCKEKGII